MRKPTLLLVVSMISVSGSALANDPVYFADPQLKTAVEDALGIADPTATDMLGLTLLDVSRGWIGNLTGIEYAVNLHLLDLSSNFIEDIYPLYGLTNLDVLDLSGNFISDIFPLCNLTNLKVLDLSYNLTISDISPLADLMNLAFLDLSMNRICDISELRGLRNLAHLTLPGNSGCTISDISPLSGLSNLVDLDLSCNDITDISPLSGLSNLAHLDLCANLFSDISPLSGLSNLTYLNVSMLGRISDISALSGLTNLIELHIDFDEIKDITALSGLSDLQMLGLTWNQITDITALSGLANLQILWLNANQITDITALSGLANLQELVLTHNQITDISGLSGMRNLNWLFLNSNPLDCRAYSYYIPLLLNNNPGYIGYDPPDPLDQRLSGLVYDRMTGKPVEGADVNIPDTPVLKTNHDGVFCFSDVEPGETKIGAAKEGYYDTSETVTITKHSATFVRIGLTPLREFGIVEVRSRFCGPDRHVYYLDDVPLKERFTATIDWKDLKPGVVRWITPKQTYEDACSGTTISRQFDVGSEFGSGGRLRLVAIGDDGSAISKEYVVNFNVIEAPLLIAAETLTPNLLGNTLKYEAYTVKFTAINEGFGGNVIPEDIPGFGGRTFRVVEMLDLSASVSGAGTAESNLKWATLKVPWEVAGAKIMPRGCAQLVWKYSSELGEWIPGGEIGLEVRGRWSSPPNYFVIPVGPITVPAYWRLAFAADIGAKLALTGWQEGGPILQGKVPFRLGPEGMLGVGIADIAAIEGYLRGEVNGLLEWPHAKPLKQLCIDMKGGVRLVVWVFKYEHPLLYYHWCLVEGKEAGMLSAPMTLGALEEVERSVFKTMGRDYLGPDYGLWMPGVQQVQPQRFMMLDADAPVPCEPDKEQLLQYNVFGQSQPTIAAEGGDLVLAWVYDDPDRDPSDMNSLNRTEVVFSKCQGGLWSDPIAIDDDRTADFSPQITVLPDGNALCVWENAKQSLPNDANLTDMAGAMEIAAAHYDSSSGVWTTEALTANSHLDRTPRIASADDGTAMAVWVHNDKDDILGLDPDAANTIQYSVWDGAGWSEPNTAAGGTGLMVKTSLAYDGREAIYVYSLDTDYDWQTETDQELYAIVYDGNDWSDPYRLTDDALLDANPQVVYDQNDPLLVWYRDANLVSLRDFDPNSFEEVFQTSGSSGSMDFRIAQSPVGQVSLIWTETSGAGVDIFTATYDAGLCLWSKAYQLTSDKGMERSVAATYAGADELALAYNKVEIVDVNGIPDANRVDLYVLRHSIASDLAISAADISLSVANPTPGSTVDVNAVIHNLGDVAEVNVPVAFYDGEPNNGGTLIDDIRIIAGPITAGDAGVATVSWFVPVVTEAQRIFVVVDPNREREDRNWANNSAAISAMASDLTVMSISSDRIGPKKRGITARIANIGTLPAENVDVVISRDSAGGPELTSFNIAKLHPNTFYDVWHVWDIAAEDFNDVEIPVYLNVDKPDNVLETNEENNISFGLLQVGKVADVTDNGRIDFVDCARLADVWLEECSEPEWCQGRDFDKSQKVDFADLKEMAEHWLWQAGWYGH